MKVIKNVPSQLTHGQVCTMADRLQAAVDAAVNPLLLASDRQALGSRGNLQITAVYVGRPHDDVWTVNSNLPERAEELEAVALRAAEAALA
jgi:hypothetical protein